MVGATLTLHRFAGHRLPPVRCATRRLHMRTVLAVLLVVSSLSTNALAAKKKSGGKVAASAGLPVKFDLWLRSGWVRLGDSTDTDTAGGDTESSAGMFGYGFGT